MNESFDDSCYITGQENDQKTLKTVIDYKAEEENQDLVLSAKVDSKLTKMHAGAQPSFVTEPVLEISKNRNNVI